MKRNFYPFITFLVLVGMLLSTGCGVLNTGKQEYYKMVDLYHAAQKAVSNFSLCKDTAMGNIYTQVYLAQAYNEAVVQQTEAYRKPLEQKSKEYLDANGQPLDPSKLDLGKLAENQALPSDFGKSIAVYVNAFVEAPIPALNPRPIENAQNAVSEAYNTLSACGHDWNEAATNYNNERRRLSAEAVSKISEILGVESLPGELPLYAGDYRGSVSQPNLPIK